MSKRTSSGFRRSIGRRIALAAGLLLPTCAFTTAARAQLNSEPRSVTAGVGIEQKPGAQVPLDCEFLDESGKTVRLGDLLDGKPAILNLVYFECPMLCGMVINGLIRSLSEMTLDPGESFTVITVSIDPTEGPEMAAAAKRTALKRYGRRGAAPHWHFLTGREPEIRKLTDRVGYYYRRDEKTGDYAHGAGLIILTPEGRVSRYLLGVDFPPRDMRLSLIESSHGDIGSVTDQVLLLCYHYDPASGTYGLLIQNVLRLAGLATVVALGGVVGTLWMRERRRRGAPRNEAPDPGEEQTSRESGS